MASAATSSTPIYLGICKKMDTELLDNDIVIHPPHGSETNPVFLAYVARTMPKSAPLLFTKSKRAGAKWQFVCNNNVKPLVLAWFLANKELIIPLLDKHKTRVDDLNSKAALDLETLNRLKYPMIQISFSTVMKSMEIVIGGKRYASLDAPTYLKTKKDMEEPAAAEVMVVKVSL